MLDGLTGMMTERGLADPDGTARKAMSLMIHRQASVLSFGDAFGVLALGCWAAVGLALFARPGKPGAAPQGAGGH
jgi:DHA2 family multidrug resistance protein